MRGEKVSEKSLIGDKAMEKREFRYKRYGVGRSKYLNR